MRIMLPGRTLEFRAREADVIDKWMEAFKTLADRRCEAEETDCGHRTASSESGSAATSKRTQNLAEASEMTDKVLTHEGGHVGRRVPSKTMHDDWDRGIEKDHSEAADTHEAAGIEKNGRKHDQSAHDSMIATKVPPLPLLTLDSAAPPSMTVSHPGGLISPRAKLRADVGLPATIQPPRKSMLIASNDSNRLHAATPRSLQSPRAPPVPMLATEFQQTREPNDAQEVFAMQCRVSVCSNLIQISHGACSAVVPP